MGYSVYYNGEIDISPELSDEHATLLDEALTRSTPALLGITAEDGQGLYHGCDWQLSGGRLSVEGESRGEQDEWLRLLIVRFFQPNGYTVSGGSVGRVTNLEIPASSTLMIIGSSR